MPLRHSRCVPTTTPPIPQTTRRLVLRPGTHVLRRSASELQVGLDPRRAVVLPDSPEVAGLLRALTSPGSPPPPRPRDGSTLDALRDSDLLMDADVLLPLVPALPHAPRSGEPGRPVTRAGVAALAAEAGDAVAARVQRRSAAQVHALPSGSPEAVPVAAQVVALVSAAGVPGELLPHGTLPDGVPAAATAGGPPRRKGTGGQGIGLLVAVGEPPREQVDGWMRAGTPHLLLRLTEGHGVVGPFVLPGETACLRCVDAHHTDVDPAWPLLVAQYASAVTRARDDTVPEPVDSILATLVCAWAARELVSYAEGRRPSTASTTVRLDPHLTALETQHWPRHPACGCAWDHLAGCESSAAASRLPTPG